MSKMLAPLCRLTWLWWAGTIVLAGITLGTAAVEDSGCFTPNILTIYRDLTKIKVGRVPRKETLVRDGHILPPAPHAVFHTFVQREAEEKSTFQHAETCFKKKTA